MEAVKLFNQDLSSLYEIKPPISKAKMTSITKGAIKAIKFYKHVVQSVEKFIQKCRPEYKIPGLYVIDSIVRQSRHQFGPDKDVFAPRFSKNVQLTFYHLYKCAEEDKSKVIRVLNLWQKNEVFPSEIIQPLFDLANPKSELTRKIEDQVKSGIKPGKSSSLHATPSKTSGGIQVASEFRSSDSHHHSHQQSSTQQSPSPNSHHSHSSATPDQHMTQQLQTILQLLKNHAQPTSDQVKFNRKLLDFDYSDEEDAAELQQEQHPSPAMLEALQGILENKVVLQKLKNMGAITDHQIQQLQQLLPAAQQQQRQEQEEQQQAAIVAATAGTSQMPAPPVGISLPQGVPPPQMLSQFQQFNPDMQQPPPPTGMLSSMASWGPPPPVPQPQPQLHQRASPSEEGERGEETDEDIQIVEDRTWRTGGSSRERRRRSRSRSRDRKRGRHSRSRSRDRGGGSRRRRSRSRDRKGSEEERQKRREREKKGLPPIRDGYLSVCSTTLWVGHLSRLVAEEDLSDLFGEYGLVNTIHLIPPRGCGFVCMNRRMDASKALKSLHKHKVQGKPITLAWAPGKGMKDRQWKDYWDVDLGVSYIPIDKLDPQVNMAMLEEGGMFDEDTMPEWMKTMHGVAPNTTAPVQLQQPAVNAGTAAANSTAGNAAQFIPVPEGIPPPNMLAAQADLNAPAAGVPPPGLPPFGLPPTGAQPPPTGVLPPGPPPNLLASTAGLLPPPQAAAAAAAAGGVLGGAPPPNLLLGPPIGQPPVSAAAAAAALMGGLPGFDASQPPPGLPRLPFPPPAGIPPPFVPEFDKPPPAVPSQEGANGENGADAEKEKVAPADKTSRRRDRGGRESRWNRESSGEPPESSNNLADRLRNLAGMNPEREEEGGLAKKWGPANGGGPPNAKRDPGGSGRPPLFPGGPFDEGPFRGGGGHNMRPGPTDEDVFSDRHQLPGPFGGANRRGGGGGGPPEALFDGGPMRGRPQGFGGRGGNGPRPLLGPPGRFLDRPLFEEFSRGGRGVRGGWRGRGGRGGGGNWMEEEANAFSNFENDFTDRPNVPPWERGRGGARGGRGGRGGFGFGALEEGPPSLFGGGTGPFGAGPDMPFGGGPVGFEAPPEGSGPFGNFRGNDEPSKPFLRRQEENRDQWRKDRKGGFASGEKKDEREGEENPKRQKREQEEDVAGEEAENPPEPKQEEGAEKDAFPEQPPYGALPPAPGNPQEGAGDSEPFSGAETETKSVAAIVGSMYDDDEDDEEEADGQSGRPEFVDEAQSHDNVRATAVEQGQELGQREIPPEDKTDTAEKAAWQLREEMPPQGVSSYSKDESPQDRTDELASESDSARESGLHANQRPLEEQHHPPEVDQEPNIQEAYSPGSQTKNDDASKDCPDHDDRGHHEES